MNLIRFKLFLLALISLLPPALKSQPIPPIKTLDVLGVNEIPEMDGKLYECIWSKEQTMNIFNPKGWDGHDDFSASFHVSWSLSHFYAFVTITDDINHSWKLGSKAWEFDNIEFFLQLDTNTITPEYNDNTMQLLFNRGDSAWAYSTGRATIDEFNWYSENTSSGWVLEAGIPWTAILPEGSQPEAISDYLPIIGFDIHATDSDNSDGDVMVGNIDVQLAWDMDIPNDPNDRTEDIAFKNTSVFGYLNLYSILNQGETSIGYCEPTGIATNQLASFQIAPNPATESIQLLNCHSGVAISVYNATGQLVLFHTAIENDPILDVSYFQTGLYFVKVGNNKIVKLIKQ